MCEWLFAFETEELGVVVVDCVITVFVLLVAEAELALLQHRIQHECGAQNKER